MNKTLPILTGLIICIQAFLACSNSVSYYAAENITETETISQKEPAEPDTVTQEQVAEPDTILKDTVECDSIAADTTEADTTAPADTTSPADTTKADTVAIDTSDQRIVIWGMRSPSNNIYLLYPVKTFLTKFEIGDVVTVEIAGYDTLEMPIVESTYDVPIAGFLVSATAGSDYVSLGVNNGTFSDIIGITDEDELIEVVMSLKEKGGYLLGIETMRHSLYLDTYRENYPDLSVDDFANFRVVRTTGMGENKLYRSSSPIYMYLGRNYYADSLAKEAGVATFINFADQEKNAKSYMGFESTYYSTQNTIFLGVPPEFFSSSFQDGLVKGLRYMIEHEGPYLVHCTYGMDRTGFSIAVLEALMGATAEEIQADYSKTFRNFYNVVDGRHVALSEEQIDFFKAVVLRNLKAVYHAKGVDIPNSGDVDWANATEQFLEKLGMTPQEISDLKDRLK